MYSQTPKVVLVALAAAVAGCGSSTSSHPGVAKSAGKVSYAAPISTPERPAPVLSLRDSLARWVDLSSFRGRAVMVTFIYSHCPDVCPLIVSNLRTAQALLGPKAKQLQIVAVSTDPAQDTPRAVNRFLAKRGMTGRIEYLLGTRRELKAVWKRWGILARRVSPTPDAVEHSALIYGIAGTGKITVAYPANFKPQWVAHDVPLLAAR